MVPNEINAVSIGVNTITEEKKDVKIMNDDKNEDEEQWQKHVQKLRERGGVVRKCISEL